MKKIMCILTMMTMFNIHAMADVVELKCKTEKGTELLIKFDNWPAKLMKLTIGGKDMSSAVTSFGTSQGSPVFTIANFPKESLSASFRLSPYPIYESTYSVSGENFKIPCEIITSGTSNKPSKDNSF